MADPQKPLMRSIGEFFGHIVQGIRTDPSAAGRTQEVGRRVEEKTVEDPDGGGQKVILRRTIIEEVCIQPPGPTAPASKP